VAVEEFSGASPHEENRSAMPTATLHRRTSQFNVLRRACASATRVTFVRRHAQARPEPARLCELLPRGVVLEQPVSAGPLVRGERIDVHFVVRGEAYRFFTCADECFRSNRGGAPCTVLRLPVCVERHEKRARRRRTVPHGLEVPVQLESVIHSAGVIPGRLTDLSHGGIGTISDAAFADRLLAGGLYWADFSASGDHNIHLIVRPAHFRRLDEQHVRVGWAFQATDYPELLASQRRALLALFADGAAESEHAAEDESREGER